MRELEPAVRAVLRELAGEGLPVDLGERALAGARRRARRRVAGAAGVTLAVALGAGLLLGPGAGTGHRPARTTPAAPVEQPAAWPAFTGVARPPGGPTTAPTDRLLVAAYLSAPGGPAHVLDPVTGRYRAPGVDRVLAVSPDLRLALVARDSPVPDGTGSGPVGVSEYGIYDTVAGRVLGRLDLAAWVDPPAGRTAWHAAWSPRGESLVLLVRAGVAGRGWLADRLLFVDLATGVVRAVGTGASGGLEPVELLGWTADGRGVALAADRVGTDEAPRGHIVYDLTGRPAGAYPWPGQHNAVPVVGADRLALLPVDQGGVTVVEVVTGAVRDRFPGQAVRAVPGWESALAWRGGELLLRPLTCPPAGGCDYGAQLLAVEAATGRSRVLHTLPQAWPVIVVAPAPAGLPAPVAALAW
ncbi:MAG TPA: hypothetical protein VFM55_13075 [Micromonosporaceae bacterium]|nr:hypothetical protein [Micromonosporaceae bacterium]